MYFPEKAPYFKCTLAIGIILVWRWFHLFRLQSLPTCFLCQRTLAKKISHTETKTRTSNPTGLIFKQTIQKKADSLEDNCRHILLPAGGWRPLGAKGCEKVGSLGALRLPRGGGSQGWEFRVTSVLVAGRQGYLIRWWFQTSFIFTPIWGRFPFWLIFFKWVETTN